MDYILPPLPYSYDALEPYIDARTMEIHHTKHHQTYIDRLNESLVGHSDLQSKSLEQLLCDVHLYPQQLATTILNNGGGHWNHSFFWKIMKKDGGGEPQGPLFEEIKRTFRSFKDFQLQFNNAAKSVFGSGWAWLCVDSKKKLVVISTVNQGVPFLQEKDPILGLDVWEHAYYLSYQNRRADYITEWWNVINWDKVEHLYCQAMSKK